MAETTPLLSERQRRAAAVAITLLSAAVVVAAVIASFFLVIRFFQAFDNVFLPLAVAGVLAMVIRPYYDWLHTTARLPTALALIVLILSLIVPILIALVVFGSLIAVQLTELLEALPEWWQGLVAYFEEHRPALRKLFNEHPVRLGVRETLQSPAGPLGDIAGYLANSLVAAGAGVVSSAVSLFGWVVMPVYLVFLLLMPKMQPEALDRLLPFLKPETRRDAVYLVREFVSLVVVFFRGQLLIALIQGLLFAIGFSVAGLKYGAVLGLLLGFLNIIPYLGSMIGLAVCLPLAYFQDGGGMTLLVIVLVVFSVVQMIEGYLLTPKIMGDRTGLHPLAIIVAIFFWGSALNGILGMILAIPLTAFLVVLWRLLREKYVTEII